MFAEYSPHRRLLVSGCFTCAVSLSLKATLGHAEVVSDELRMRFQGDAGPGQ